MVTTSRRCAISRNDGNGSKVELLPLLAERWQLDAPTLIADTHTAYVFRALRHGQSVIVKCFKDDATHELPGLSYLTWRNGSGAVRVLETDSLACLMEDGGALSLRDIHREKGEYAANAILATALPAIFGPADGPYPTRLRDIEAHFSALFSFAARSDLGVLEAPLRLAAATAETLLASQPEKRPLHGDIHHENLVSRDGLTWRLIDPHGLIGDPHYDVANLFGNPIDNPEVVLSPVRAASLSEILSSALGLDRERMLQFALAHCGLSVAWHLEDARIEHLDTLPERIHLLSILRSLLSNDHSNICS